MGFPGDSVVKNSYAKQETQVQSLGQEDPMEKEIIYCSFLAWEIQWQGGARGATVHGVTKRQT